MTTVKLKLIVYVDVDQELIQDEKTLLSDLKGEFVKVKSGTYENMLVGDIVSATVR